MEQTILNSLISDQDIVRLLLLLGIVAVARLYMMERSERRDAWNAYNTLAASTNEVLNKLGLTLEGLKERIRHD